MAEMRRQFAVHQLLPVEADEMLLLLPGIPCVVRKPGAGTLWLFAGIVACATLPVVDSVAQSYPVKPIRMLVGFPVGVGSDTAARMVAQKLPDHLGQPVVVENRTGAAGQLATERVATSPHSPTTPSPIRSRMLYIRLSPGT